MTRATSLFLLAASALSLGAAIIQPQQKELKPEERKLPSKVTYAEHIAPIIDRSCVACHRPGAVAPFSLIGYDNAKKWSSNVAALTESRGMPPWKAVRGYGEFYDDKQLSDTEIAMIRKWYEEGTPRGDKAKEPPEPNFTSEWPLREPDLILSPEKPFKLDAEGDDVYRNFVMKTTFDHPVWVNAMAIKPGNPKVVHHVITFLDNNGWAKKLEAKFADGQEGYTTSGGGVGFIPSGTLGGWAPGVTTRETPPGTAFLVQPGTTLVLQVHYHKSGKPEEDLTRVGLYFAKEPIKKEMQLDWVFNFGIHLPAGEKAHQESKVQTIPADGTIYGAMPHMHLLGRQMKAWLEFPDGSTKPLVWVDDWDFNWQLTYAFKEPIHVVKGTKVHVEAIYDNSSSNPRNPNNPPKDVGWGEQTTDEMFLLILPYTADAEKTTDNWTKG